jgi:hypothetical protein
MSPVNTKLDGEFSTSVRNQLIELRHDLHRHPELSFYPQSDGGRRQSAERLLGEIDEWRLDYGKPVSEPRHPFIESNAAWPPVTTTG